MKSVQTNNPNGELQDLFHSAFWNYDCCSQTQYFCTLLQWSILSRKSHHKLATKKKNRYICLLKWWQLMKSFALEGDFRFFVGPEFNHYALWLQGPVGEGVRLWDGIEPNTNDMSPQWRLRPAHTRTSSFSTSLHTLNTMPVLRKHLHRNPLKVQEHH